MQQSSIFEISIESAGGMRSDRVKLAERVVGRGAVQEVGWHARVQPDRVREILPYHQ